MSMPTSAMAATAAGVDLVRPAPEPPGPDDPVAARW